MNRTATTIETSATVGELVTQNPARARVFEQFGIDYCCGGKVPFEKACSAKGVDAGAVLALLEHTDRAEKPDRYVDVSAMTLTELADHIQRTHHNYLRRELPRIDALLQKVVRAHGQRRPELLNVQSIFASFVEEMTSHMMKEERVLFPAIRTLDQGQSGFHCGSIANPIRQMESEHESAGDALSQFRQLTGGYATPADVCNTYRALMDALADLEQDTHQHVHKENNVLFPKSIEREQAIAG